MVVLYEVVHTLSLDDSSKFFDLDVIMSTISLVTNHHGKAGKKGGRW